MNDSPPRSDLLIDEVRARAGGFANVPREPPSGELFPEAATPKPDPLLDELRKLRRK